MGVFFCVCDSVNTGVFRAFGDIKHPPGFDRSGIPGGTLAARGLIFGIPKQHLS